MLKPDASRHKTTGVTIYARRPIWERNPEAAIHEEKKSRQGIPDS